MKNIVIKFNDNFKSFCKSIGEDEKKMNDKILKSLYELGVVQDGPEDCGLTIEQLCIEVGVLPVVVMQQVFNQFVGVLQMFQNLEIIGIMEDCPYCGWIRESEYDGNLEINKCLNRACDFEESFNIESL